MPVNNWQALAVEEAIARMQALERTAFILDDDDQNYGSQTMVARMV